MRHADTGLQERRDIEVQTGKTVKLAIEWRMQDK